MGLGAMGRGHMGRRSVGLGVMGTGHMGRRSMGLGVKGKRDWMGVGT